MAKHPNPLTLTELENIPDAALVPARALEPGDLISTLTTADRRRLGDWARVTKTTPHPETSYIDLTLEPAWNARPTAETVTLTVPADAHIPATIHIPTPEGPTRPVLVIGFLSGTGDDATMSGLHWSRPDTPHQDVVDAFNKELDDDAWPESAGYWTLRRLFWMKHVPAPLFDLKDDGQAVTDFIEELDKTRGIADLLPAVERFTLIQPEAGVEGAGGPVCQAHNGRGVATLG